jgi:hypothetical protein
MTNSLMKFQLALFIIIHECATEGDRHGLQENAANKVNETPSTNHKFTPNPPAQQ